MRQRRLHPGLRRAASGGGSRVTPRGPSYAAITPARDEAVNLRRLGDCMLRQTRRPEAWIIVDDGSRDETPEVVAELSRGEDWIRIIRRPQADEGALADGRAGGRDIMAFNAGVAALGQRPG